MPKIDARQTQDAFYKAYKEEAVQQEDWRDRLVRNAKPEERDALRRALGR